MSVNTEKILNILKTLDSPRDLYNTLLRIHSDIISTEDGLRCFKEQGGIGYVIQYLSKPNKRILNISLGILAHCCTDVECRNKIVSDGILKHLTAIMGCVNEDRISYRCCKLIENLARYPNLCSMLISNKVCDLLVPILNGSPSLATQLAAVRSLRYIWNGANINERKIIIRSDVLKSSVQYLESGNKGVQKSVLGILYCVSRFRADVVLKQSITDEVLTQIVSKTRDYSSIVLRIVYYLSEMKYFHFKLVKAGVLEAIFSHVCNMSPQDLEPTKEVNMDLVLRSLYRLSNEPQCRERLRSIPDAFDTLLDIIENSTYLKFKKYSVLILTSYIYNVHSLRILVKQRLIWALITYVQIIVKTQGIPHDNDDSRCDLAILTNSPTSSGRLSPLSDSEMSGSYSPSPTSERFTTSPTLSIDSIYSPVCSPVLDDIDDDEMEEDTEKMSIGDASSKADSPLILQDDDIGKSLTEEKIFNLLKQLACTQNPQEPIFDLCAQRTWETLLDYLTQVRKTPALLTSLLSSIAGYTYFFKELLKSQFALTVHKKLCRPIHVDCSVCQEMNKCGCEILARYRGVAESHYGLAILRDEIKKNTLDEVLLALTIPHIIQNLNVLEEYLLRYKILTLIMDSLSYDEVLFEEKVASLYSLATSVHLENPRTPCTLCKKCDVASLTKEATVSFLLDDGSTVTANKRSICEKSEFFEAMFRCGFKEAKESVVRLSNISSDCLTVLFRLLYDYCDCILPRNVVVLLELIVQSDRFLIPALSDKLLHITMNCRLDYQNCHLIYDWAIENGRFLPSSDAWPICHSVIKYALVEKLTLTQRVHSLRMLLRSRYKDKVISDIKQIMEHQLKRRNNKTKSLTNCTQEGASKRLKPS